MRQRPSVLQRLMILPLESLGLALLLGAGGPKGPPPRPNLLLITIDTLRADRVGFYSDRHVGTPQIDSLASRGVVFTRAFSHSPTTLPAHTNILLGATPSYHGVHDNTNFVVRGEFLTLAEHLKNFGYATGAFIGGFPLESRFGLDQGFDTYDDRFDRTGPTPSESGTRRAENVLAGALAWLGNKEAPWFLWIHFWDPHEPYSPPEPYRTRYADRPYDGEVAYVDAVLGDLFQYLKERGLVESSLIVLTGDHGESLGEHGEGTHGFLAYNTTLWVPLIIAQPGLGHRVVPEPVSHVDIFPTVCDLLGILKPGRLQGASLVPSMKGGKPGEGPIYFESLSPYYNMGWAPIAGFIRGDDKFIDSPIPEVYDLGKDFDETRNIADARAAAAGKEELAGLVREQSSMQADKAERRPDRETVERLRSLGYVAGLRTPGKARPENFGPEDDVKALLPFYEKAMGALGLYRGGKTREAVEEVKEVIGARKNISTAYLNLAYFYKEEGRMADAASVLKTGFEALPNNYYVFLEYVTCLYEIGEFDEAIRVFEGKRPPQVEFDPVIWNYAGLARLKKGDEAKARECLERSLRIDADFAVTWYEMGNLHYSTFQRTGDRSRLDQAEASLRKAIALDPGNGPAHYVLGVTLFQKKDYPGAAAGLEKALALDPNLNGALYYLGLVYFQKADPARACSYFKKFRMTPGFDLLSVEEKAMIEGILAKCSGREGRGGPPQLGTQYQFPN